ncbi:peptidoglycan recognition protein family protein [Cellulosilyticum sp. I15G10I2]|uniref:peptidoglycan recognition protein family protein n=1 Tax=Cellulosilyticum sp. I15G10I2 TaxID=1892843 RepID=UPI00085C0BF8|nr:N-acetylmuramoyl-L-alanine amidase [Cellulosilyticum sp. I15G10I2]
MKQYKDKSHRRQYYKDAVFIMTLIALIGVAMLVKPKPKPIVQKDIEKVIGIPYTIDTIPESGKRPGRHRKIKYIVVHNTANETSDARSERNYLTNITNTSDTSWHIVVDEREIIEAIPLNEVAHHAGSSVGNEYGIGIEICESGNYEQSEENAIKLIAYLMKYYKIPLSRVTTHQHFSGKACPRLILENWDAFIDKVEKEFRGY